ncbi:MAG: hypothetical protein JO189_25780 [Deltaproteobacteria bacterium]|nr:hypothetical protein [Deltaproteobacteria bacterium]
MAHDQANSQLRLTVSAVLSYLRIPAHLIAALNTASCIEIEHEDIAPILTFEIQGHIVARGYVKEHAGMLSATIFWTGCEPSDRQFDHWTLKRDLATGDSTDDRDGNDKAK